MGRTGESKIEKPVYALCHMSANEPRAGWKKAAPTTPIQKAARGFNICITRPARLMESEMEGWA